MERGGEIGAEIISVPIGEGLPPVITNRGDYVFGTKEVFHEPENVEPQGMPATGSMSFNGSAGTSSTHVELFSGDGYGGADPKFGGYSKHQRQEQF